jgi:hypothetical protein
MSNDFRSIKEHLSDRDYLNRKPYRTSVQKAEAKRLARVVDGRWVSTASVTKHPITRASR